MSTMKIYSRLGMVVFTGAVWMGNIVTSTVSAHPPCNSATLGGFLSNGFIGIRSNANPLSVGHSTLSGTNGGVPFTCDIVAVNKCTLVRKGGKANGKVTECKPNRFEVIVSTGNHSEYHPAQPVEVITKGQEMDTVQCRFHLESRCKKTV